MTLDKEAMHFAEMQTHYREQTNGLVEVFYADNRGKQGLWFRRQNPVTTKTLQSSQIVSGKQHYMSYNVSVKKLQHNVC